MVDFEDFHPQHIYTQAMSEPILIVTMDSKGIVMREDDLRENTRQKAYKNRHKLNKRLSRGEKRDRKRMATVASVYSISPHYRTPYMVAKESYPYNKKDKKPKPVGKRVWASVEKSVENVVDENIANLSSDEETVIANEEEVSDDVNSEDNLEADEEESDEEQESEDEIYTEEELEEFSDSELADIMNKLDIEPMEEFDRDEAISAILEAQENANEDEDEDDNKTNN